MGHCCYFAPDNEAREKQDESNQNRYRQWPFFPVPLLVLIDQGNDGSDQARIDHLSGDDRPSRGGIEKHGARSFNFEIG